MTAFLDTNIAVYAYDRSAGEKQTRAQEVIATRTRELVVSSQVLAEFYRVTTGRLDPPLDAQLAREATAALAALTVVAVDGALVLAAIDTAIAADISVWDAMIVQAARRAGCDEILTEDLNTGQIIEGVRIHDPLVGG
jgi:predicted nucleic acid-binding protein